jgi:outer membrane protein assembly factor BamB
MPVVTLLAAWLSLALFQAPQSAAPILGKWSGMVGTPLERVEISIEFTENAQKEVVGRLYQRVSNYYGTELGVVKVEGSTYRIGTLLEATLKDDVLEGTYFSLKMPITLRRSTTLPAEVPIANVPTGPGPAWRQQLGSAIYAPAAIRDGVAYVGTSGGMFYAINTADGAFVWPFAAGRPIYGEATVTADAVFFACDDGYLYRLERATGKLVWRYDLGDARAARTLPHQVVDQSGAFDWVTSSPKPVLVDGVLYVGSGDNSLHAVRADTGERVWRGETGGAMRTDAIVVGGRVIAGGIDHVLYAFDQATGRELWKVNTRGPITGSPSIVAGKVVVGNRNGALGAYDPADGKRQWVSVLWGSAVESTAVPGEGSLFYMGSSDLRRLSLIDAADGRVVWRTDVFGWPWGRPAVDATRVFIGAGGVTPYEIRHVGGVAALDRRTGALLWRWPAPEMPGAFLSGFIAAPTVDAGRLIIGGLDGTLYGFKLS